MKKLLVACAAIAAVLAAAVPAIANTRSITDRHGDTPSTMDIYSTTVNNKLPNLVVTTHLRSIRHPGAEGGGLEVYVDTSSSRPGPEFVLGTGVNCNCEWNVFRLRDWTHDKGGPLNCRSRVSWSVAAATVTTSLSRACIGHASKVRVSVAAFGPRSGEDWAPARHRFTPWVKATQISTPVMNDCFAAKRKPAHWQLACGDGNGYFDRARWTHWTKTYATGTARQWYNTCKPSCADGNYRRFRVHVRLDVLGTTDKRFYFKRFRYGRTSLRSSYPLYPKPVYPGQA